jgi:hypothetical protein
MIVNSLLKHIIEEKTQKRAEVRKDEEDVCNYWMTLTEQENTGI